MGALPSNLIRICMPQKLVFCRTSCITISISLSRVSLNLIPSCSSLLSPAPSAFSRIAALGAGTGGNNSLSESSSLGSDAE
eukprot:IDg9703t1